MKKGFTLIELLIVLVIIGILVGLILPNMLQSIDNAHVRECAANLRSIDAALENCYTRNNSWTVCNTIPALTGGGFLENIPATSSGGVAYTLIADPNSTGFISDKAAHFPAWPSLAGYIG